jgi:heat shock protein HslJ
MVRARIDRRAIALFAAVLAVATACGSSDVAGDNAAMLIGHTFLSQSVTVDNAPHPLVSGTQIRLTFTKDHRITASAGCNLMSGTLRIGPDRLELTEMGSTEMGCDPARQAQDEWLASVLGARPGYVIDHETLRLVTANTTIELVDREVADPDRPLKATVWNVDGLVDATSTSTIPAGTAATIVFGDDRVDVTIAACNQGSAGVTVTTTTIEVDRLVLTDLACTGPGAQLQAAIVAALHGKLSYVIEAANLRLTGADGKGLTLRAQQ